ncbi:hypothetical protein Tco_1005282 [Tanacetum coccineum]|uniref:Uncharacterized protein n=1 Tax=Tanacetum coccineum TaxID=301880 RepID=A0ABQ5FFA0_9ASTR
MNVLTFLSIDACMVQDMVKETKHGPSDGLGLRLRYITDDEAGLVKRCVYFLLELVFTLPRELRTSLRAPSNFTNGYPTSPSTVNCHGLLYSKAPQQNEACHQDEVHPTERLMVRRHDTFQIRYKKRFMKLCSTLNGSQGLKQLSPTLSITLKGPTYLRFQLPPFARKRTNTHPPFQGETLSLTISPTWNSIGFLRFKSSELSVNHELLHPLLDLDYFLSGSLLYISDRVLLELLQLHPTNSERLRSDIKCFKRAALILR